MSGLVKVVVLRYGPGSFYTLLFANNKTDSSDTVILKYNATTVASQVRVMV